MFILYEKIENFSLKKHYILSRVLQRFVCKLGIIENPTDYHSVWSKGLWFMLKNKGI